MNEDYDFPTQDEHFNGLEEEIHSDEANNPFVHCCNCGELCEQGNLIEGVCEDCWDDQQDDPYYCDDDVWHDADALSSAGYGTDEDYGDYGGEYL